MPGKFEIKSIRGGKSEFLDRGIAGAFKLAKNANIRDAVDALSCNQALITDGNAASIVVDTILFWVNAADGNGYGFGNAGKIYKRTAAAVWSVVYTDADGAILGASEWYNDTQTYLYWATSTKLHRKLIPGNTSWTDVDATIASVAATGVLTVSGIPKNNSKVSIGSVVYTFVTNLSTSPTVLNQVKIGASAEISIDNLVLAINLGAGIGTNYSTGTLVHPTCSAAKTTASTMTVTAREAGSGGNYIGTYGSGDYLSFAQPFLKNGISYSTWPKINLTSTAWHTMAQADGSLMICNAKVLAQVGFDDSYTNEALKLRYGVIAKTVNDYGNSVLIGGGDGVKDSWLLTWDHSAQNWTNKNRIPVKSINAVADAEIMLMNCGDNELFFSNLTDKMRVATMEGKCNPGGVAEDHGMALFGLYGGTYSGIWSYGRKDKNGVHALNLEYYVDADEIGAIWFIGDTLFLSYRKGATKAVLKVNSAAKAVAEYYSLDLKAPREVPWQTVELLTDTLPTDSKIEVFYAVKSLKISELATAENWTRAELVGGTDFASTGRNPIFMVGSDGRIINLKLVITPATNASPVIHEIYVNFL